ncbi:hypothetical protein FQN60_006110 [Etheostoma spectabile]|uniref:Uncharacterized protein n=1 Tax=Etheostoma spectabile TaxID=54343 RepID=A0A5J5CNF1_9PERO|nr:hypothetical protein FQN60_006110 [Etheostoma spectabile]
MARAHLLIPQPLSNRRSNVMNVNARHRSPYPCPYGRGSFCKISPSLQQLFAVFATHNVSVRDASLSPSELPLLRLFVLQRHFLWLRCQVAQKKKKKNDFRFCRQLPARALLLFWGWHPLLVQTAGSRNSAPHRMEPCLDFFTDDLYWAQVFANGTFLYAAVYAENLSKATICRTIRNVYLALKGHTHIFLSFPGHIRINYIKEGFYNIAAPYSILPPLPLPAFPSLTSLLPRFLCLLLGSFGPGCPELPRHPTPVLRVHPHPISTLTIRSQVPFHPTQPSLPYCSPQIPRHPAQLSPSYCCRQVPRHPAPASFPHSCSWRLPPHTSIPLLHQ